MIDFTEAPLKSAHDGPKALKVSVNRNFLTFQKNKINK
jgi:hypothetical protein